MPDLIDSPERRRWGRRLLVAAGLLLGWAVVIALTGGFLIELGPIRLSSRNASRVLLLALLALVSAWRLAYRDWVTRRARAMPGAIANVDRWLHTTAPAFERAAPALAWALGAILLACGVGFGSRVAGGADAYGYVSESVLWSHGLLGIDQGYARSLPWPNAAGSFVPLAYRMGGNGVMGPTVAPGLPLLMAFARLFTACGPYLVVPLSGAALVVATFYLGRRFFGTAAATVACALVACSPVVIFESLVVMADVPAAALWTCALVAAGRSTPRASLVAGALTAAAILIRPNLLPLALFPWLLSIAATRTVATFALRTVLFAVASLPAALFIAWINHRLYGSAFSSGYGDLAGAFAIAHAGRNLRLYSGWWLESQGPLAFLFVAWVVRRRFAREQWILAAYAVSAALLYLFYLPFDQWWYLRFLIPAIPIALLLCADAVNRLAGGSALLRVILLGAFTAAAGSHALRFADDKDLFSNRAAEERRYLDAAIYIDRILPGDAVILAMQHSGSVRYYTGRLTMRWDTLDRAWLDRAVESLRSRGIPVYAMLEWWEETEFRARFAGQRTVRDLPGAMAVTGDGELRLYAVGNGKDRIGPAEVIPQWLEPGCVGASPQFVHPGAARRLAGDRNPSQP